MRRHLLPVAVVLADTGVTVSGRLLGAPVPAATALAVTYLVLVVAVVALGFRAPVVAFVAALVLATVTGGGYILLLWAAFTAGRAVWTRSAPAVIVGATAGAFAVQFVSGRAGSRAAAYLAAEFAVFVVTPLLAGRYVAQQRLLVHALDQRNAELRQRRELDAEQERLRERMRIARDMHDALGRRLSLVSIQAAALEVSPLPPEQLAAVHRLARAARDAADELHRSVGALRADHTVHDGQTALPRLIEDFRSAGVSVSLTERGRPRGLSTVADQVAYRVVEEGLTNAAKHAPGQPVEVRLDWESDALLLIVANPTPALGPILTPDGPGNRAAGHGLAGLAERVRPVGGLLDAGPGADGFRLVAMLPAIPDGPPPDAAPAGAAGRFRLALVGVATAALVFVIVPAGMLLGVR